jgi:hypothetical protein
MNLEMASPMPGASEIREKRNERFCQEMKQ